MRFASSAKLRAWLPAASIALVALFGSSLPVWAGALFYETNNGNHLIAIDTATGAYTDIGALGYNNTSASAFDDRTGTYYALLSVSSGHCQLGTVNLTTGAATPVGSAWSGGCGMTMEIDNSGTIYIAGGNGTNSWLSTMTVGGTPSPSVQMGFPNVMDLAFDTQGTLYAVQSPPPGGNSYPQYSDVYRIDTSTGQGTFVGRINVPGVMGLAFDASNTPYFTSVVAPNHPLYTIDTTNGNVTLIGGTGAGFPHGGDILVPEPGAWLTMSAGLLAILAIRRRARRI